MALQYFLEVMEFDVVQNVTLLCSEIKSALGGKENSSSPTLSGPLSYPASCSKEAENTPDAFQERE